MSMQPNHALDPTARQLPLRWSFRVRLTASVGQTRCGKAMEAASARQTMKLLGVLLGILVLRPAGACLATQDAAIDVRLHSGTALEERGREQLARILKTYDLEKWLFTRVVIIQSRVIPHSHPILTLNTQYLDDDDAQLATLIHEQLHWFITDHVSEVATEAAVEDLRKLFPRVPTKLPEGARGERSTYLHLIICYLELEAMSELLGAATAQKQLATWPYYTWVYSTVLADTKRIREIVNERIGSVRKNGTQ